MSVLNDVFLHARTSPSPFAGGPLPSPPRALILIPGTKPTLVSLLRLSPVLPTPSRTPPMSAPFPDFHALFSFCETPLPTVFCFCWQRFPPPRPLFVDRCIFACVLFSALCRCLVFFFSDLNFRLFFFHAGGRSVPLKLFSGVLPFFCVIYLSLQSVRSFLRFIVYQAVVFVNPELFFFFSCFSVDLVPRVLNSSHLVFSLYPALVFP